MGRPAGWMKELTGRSAMKSPGRPSHRREGERWFWREIAKGLGEEAARAIGVPQGAASRWFRERRGMATLLRDRDSCRVAVPRRARGGRPAAPQGRGVREIAR